jgi:hypothetical protein
MELKNFLMVVFSDKKKLCFNNVTKIFHFDFKSVFLNMFTIRSSNVLVSRFCRPFLNYANKQHSFPNHSNLSASKQIDIHYFNSERFFSSSNQNLLKIKNGISTSHFPNANVPLRQWTNEMTLQFFDCFNNGEFRKYKDKFKGIDGSSLASMNVQQFLQLSNDLNDGRIIYNTLYHIKERGLIIFILGYFFIHYFSTNKTFQTN